MGDVDFVSSHANEMKINQHHVSPKTVTTVTTNDMQSWPAGVPAAWCSLCRPGRVKGFRDVARPAGALPGADPAQIVSYNAVSVIQDPPPCHFLFPYFCLPVRGLVLVS